MTKRLAGMAIAAAAAASFALSAAPASADDCVYYGTFPLVCLDDILSSTEG